jgi:hypothetical protein
MNLYRRWKIIGKTWDNIRRQIKHPGRRQNGKGKVGNKNYVKIFIPMFLIEEIVFVKEFARKIINNNSNTKNYMLKITRFLELEETLEYIINV